MVPVLSSGRAGGGGGGLCCTTEGDHDGPRLLPDAPLTAEIPFPSGGNRFLHGASLGDGGGAWQGKNHCRRSSR